MQTVSQRTLSRYRGAIDKLADDPKKIILGALRTLEWNDVTADANTAVSIMRQACTSGTDLAAVASAEFYKAMRRDALGGQWATLAASGFDPKANEGAVRAFVNDVLAGNVDVFERKCLGRYEYEVLNSARNCIVYNAQRDTAEVGYALVPEGDCCAYCAELASFGFVEQWGGWNGTVHEHCRCMTVPGFEGQTIIDGYEPKDYTGIESVYDMPF